VLRKGAQGGNDIFREGFYAVCVDVPLGQRAQSHDLGLDQPGEPAAVYARFQLTLLPCPFEQFGQVVFDFPEASVNEVRAGRK